MNQGSGLTPAWPELRAFLRKGREGRRKRSDVRCTPLLYLLSASHKQPWGPALKGFTNPGEKESKTGLLVRGVGALADGQWRKAGH